MKLTGYLRSQEQKGGGGDGCLACLTGCCLCCCAEGVFSRNINTTRLGCANTAYLHLRRNVSRLFILETSYLTKSLSRACMFPAAFIRTFLLRFIFYDYAHALKFCIVCDFVALVYIYYRNVMTYDMVMVNAYYYRLK